MSETGQRSKSVDIRMQIFLYIVGASYHKPTLACDNEAPL